MKKEEKEIPSLEMVKSWVKRDLTAAHYFMGILQRYPEIIDRLAEEIYEQAMVKENGAAVDHIHQK